MVGTSSLDTACTGSSSLSKRGGQPRAERRERGEKRHHERPVGLRQVEAEKKTEGP